jgi:O-antigen/teichoic acid export membrane protein
MTSGFRPALILMIGRTAGFAITFLIPIILVRVFDQAEFGAYKQIFLLHATLFGIAQLGMAETLYYFIPSSPKHAPRYIANAGAALFASGLGCVVLVAFWRTEIAGWMNNPALYDSLLLLAIYLLLTLVSTVLEITMITRGRHHAAAISYAASDAVRALLLVAPALFFGSLRWLMIGAAAFAALRLLATGIYLYHAYGPRMQPDARLFTQQTSYAAPFQIAVMIEVAFLNLHQYMVSYQYDAATFAIYAVGILQIPLVDFIANPACNVMMVGMREHIRDSRNDAAVSLWRDTTGKLAMIFFPLAALLVVCGWEIITWLFTSRYAASVPVFVVWSAAIVLSAVQVDGLLRVYAATRALLLINLVRLAVAAASINWCLSHFGLTGAVIATVGAMLAGKVLGLGMARRLLPAACRDLLPWKTLGAALAASCVAGVLAYATKSLLPPFPLPRLALPGAVHVLSYFLVLLCLGVRPPSARFPLFGFARPAAVSTRTEHSVGVR